MEVLSYFYMWDNSWLYQIQYPLRPSRINLALGFVLSVIAACAPHCGQVYTLALGLTGMLVFLLGL